MVLSDVSIKRPVFATVLSLLIVVFGLAALMGLPVREYPDIDPPVVSVSTDYTGAAAEVVDTQITQVIEGAISGIEGIRSIESSTEQGESRTTIEFNTSRDIDIAANDHRNGVRGPDRGGLHKLKRCRLECPQNMLDLHTGQLRRPDTDANAGKFVRPKGRDDRLKAVTTTCTTLFSYTHRTGRQVYIVGHYQDIFGT